MDKKTIIYGLVGVIIVAGIIWYAGQNKQVADQVASLAGMKTENQNQEEESEEGPVVGEVTASDIIVGDPEAPVTMIEYSSHFCGHCIDFHENTLPLLTDRYVKTGKLKIVQRTLGAPEMGTAVLCAEEQDAFQQYNTYLFEHITEAQSLEDVENMAGKAGLDQDEFSQCFSSGKYQGRVENWYTQAQEAGITGTPSFFVGEELIVGNQPFTVFEQAIEAELRKAGQ